MSDAERRPEIKEKPESGSIEVIAGCMFSGKTDEMIRRLEREEIALDIRLKNNVINQRTKDEYIRVFKPSIDIRYSENNIDSHCGTKFPAIPLEKNRPGDIYDYIKYYTKVVAIDEAQFFSRELVQICHNLTDLGIRVIVAGLDTNFRGETFGPMGDLLARANKVLKLTAVCVVCGKDNANRTQRLVNGKPANYNDPEVVVGASELYEARCELHHEVLGSTV
ncbi:thymidine kinase [Candidatus Woesebacteria bacterium RBG_16_36_11]|uniref:Thymidine kinase n=3 Tax=Candidatus Woeseibacteriota TaxID=1752722 RepID=A0A1F7XBR0_9BACT|nr:MAG: thymidine kinase [Candidatus Woesebacteria bacterium RBG_13_36_22]OGM12457.1 MAG: thymidine kinase [Candidatus Woesebacteria bacterium RBG_16_36_11]OGM15636.1 MAG: thymidine kinase [Candidatus Woesebacteria bacterium RBG_19FT_COMBO_37_29]